MTYSRSSKGRRSAASKPAPKPVASRPEPKPAAKPAKVAQQPAPAPRAAVAAAEPESDDTEVLGVKIPSLAATGRKIRDVFTVDALPTSAAGKIQKVALRELVSTAKEPSHHA